MLRRSPGPRKALKITGYGATTSFIRQFSALPQGLFPSRVGLDKLWANTDVPARTVRSTTAFDTVSAYTQSGSKRVPRRSYIALPNSVQESD